MLLGSEDEIELLASDLCVIGGEEGGGGACDRLTESQVWITFQFLMAQCLAVHLMSKALTYI
jgi:hypothetical protein